MENRRPVPRLDRVCPGDVLLCALSGGADSVCLTALVQKVPGVSVYAAHFNHKLRGAESERDEAFVRHFCSERKIPLVVGHADVKAEARRSKEGLEECGRRLRYAFLEETAEKLHQTLGRPVWILTAHTASDQAETVLFRLARGTVLTGLGGILYRRGRILRPILHLFRDEVETFCREQGLSFVQDSSNDALCYARNRIRHVVLPELEEVHGGAARHLAQSAALRAEEEAYLSTQAEELWQRACTPAGLNLSVLQQAPRPLVRRVLARFLREAGVLVTAERVEELFSWFHQPYARTTIGEVLLVASKGVLSAQKLPKMVEFSPVELHAGEQVFTPSGKAYKIQILDTTASDKFHNFYKNSFYLAWDCAKISGVPILRTRRTGDRIRLAGRGCTKSIKKLFSEAAVPLAERDRRFVLADDDGVFAVEGFGCDERVCCTETTTCRMVLLPATAYQKKEG